MSRDMRYRLHQFDWGLVVAALLPLIAILPTFGDGIVNGADAQFHTHRIHAMSELLGSGNLWPRWVTYFHLGYGYPVFNFYAPGATYIGGMIELLGFSTVTAYTLVNALAWMIGSIGTYRLARTFLPIPAALLAAMLWVYAPSRFFEFWWQGSLAQTVSAAFIPYLFYGIVNTSRKPTLKASLSIAIPCAGIALSHTPMTYITGLFAAPFTILLLIWQYRLQRREAIKQAIHIGSGVLLGLGLSTIFLLPMLVELPHIRAASEAPDTVSYLTSNFLRQNDLFVFPQAIDRTDLRLDMPRTLGLIGGILSIIGILGLIRHRKYALALLLMSGLVLVIFMTIESSLDIWLTIPYFRQLRFPERFLRVGAVIVAVLGGCSLLLISRRWQIPVAGIAMAFVLIQALPIIQPGTDFVNWDNVSPSDEIDMEVTQHNWGTTAYDEFEPIWGDIVPYDPPPDYTAYDHDPFRIPVKETDTINLFPTLQADEPTGNRVTITLTEPLPVRFRQYYFPGWTATVNGESIEVYPDEQFGLLAIDLSDGEHTVELTYSGTPIQHIATIITAMTIATVIIIAYRTRRTSVETQAEENLSPRAATPFISVIIGFAVINTAILLPGTHLFIHESPPDTPIYMQTAVNQSFGGVIELLGYTLDTTDAAPGQDIDIILYWRAEADNIGEYRPVVQIVNQSITEAWAVSEPLTPTAGHTTTFTINRFASDIHRLRIFEDAPPYIGHISIQLLDATTGEPLQLDNGSDRLLLNDTIRINGAGVQARQGLDFRLGQQIELWCSSIQQDDTHYTIDLYWHVVEQPTQLLTVLIHGLDVNGGIIIQNDGLPLNGDYPSIFWLPGQTLRDTHTLPYDSDISVIGVGLYETQSTVRLPVTEAGTPVSNDRILLPVNENQCEP